MLATLRSCMSWNVCLRLCDVGAWRPLCGLGHNRERGEMRRVRGRRRRECSINVSFSQPRSSASYYGSVTISAQLAPALPHPEFQDISLKLSTFLCLKYSPKVSLCLVVCQLVNTTCLAIKWKMLTNTVKMKQIWTLINHPFVVFELEKISLMVWMHTAQPIIRE